MRRKLFSVALCATMVAGLFAGCGNSSSSDKSSAKGSVYWLNFKPEADEALQDIAKTYEKEKGVKVKVVTAASGNYNSTLTSEMGKSAAPTLFVVGNQAAVKTWDDYCIDLKDTDVYKELSTDAFNLTDADGKVCSIGYCYESYGIIVNKKLLKEAGYEVTDIKDFASLKSVAEDIHKRADKLGFDAFTSSGMDDSSSWRFTGHLANMPLFYEGRDEGWTEAPSEIKGTYLDNYKKVWDLYINNSKYDKNSLATGGYDAEAEFKNGEAVFFQNGSWEYSELSKTFKDDELAMIPIYFGVDDENEGLCVGTENYWAVNAKASQEDIDATLEFLNWVITSDEGRDAITNQMGLTAPYDTFTGDYETKNAFAQAANKLMTDGKTSVAWSFNATPNVDDWRADVVSALTAYTAGEGEWDAVKTAFVDGWANQWKIAHEDDAQ